MPSLAIISSDMVNSQYTNDVYKLQDCYLVFDGEQAKDCYYGETFVLIKDSMDFLVLTESELCYECVNCENCYNLKFSRFSKNCSNSWFLKDCIGVKNSFACVNLHQKEYCIFNEQKTKQEYEQFMATFHSSHWIELQSMKERVEVFFRQHPVKDIRTVQCQSAIGDNLTQCKDCWWCFDCNGVGGGLRDCRYCTNMQMGASDCMDVHVWGNQLELCYECCAVGESCRELICCLYVATGCSNISYSLWCLRNCQNLFGCISLKKKQYCILNTQYSKEEYEQLLPKIIQHLQKTGEWGQFFPASDSPFGYNETLAQEYFPSSKEEVLKRGWKWSDYEVDMKADRVLPAEKLPDALQDIPDDVLNWAIRCEITGRPFKLTQQELRYYRDYQLPIPRRHPDQRHKDRMTLKNPRKLWDRKCDNCGKGIHTSYSSERLEKVYCEECYLKEVY